MHPRKLALVVEDDLDIGEAVAGLLESLGLEAKVVRTGRQAIEWLDNASERPCGVLLDLTLPDLNGRHVLQHMKASPILASIPVVVMTGVAEPDGLPPGIRLLRKPMAIDELTAVVEQCCGPSA